MFSTHTVIEGFESLHFHKGLLKGRLSAGRHRFLGLGHRFSLVDVRPRQNLVAGQDLTTLDGAVVRVSLMATSKIVDLELAYRSGDVSVDDYHRSNLGSSASLHVKCQVAMRDWVSVRKFEDAYRDRAEISAFVQAQLAEHCQTVGLSLLSVDLVDFSPTGGLKAAMADLVKVEMEGQAALARARNEAATMRSLLNTARLVREHPKLLELRILSSGQKPRVTFVVSSDDTKSLPEPTEEN